MYRLRVPSIGQIPIRGDDFSWEYEGRGATDGKQVRVATTLASPREGVGGMALNRTDFVGRFKYLARCLFSSAMCAL